MVQFHPLPNLYRTWAERLRAEGLDVNQLLAVAAVAYTEAARQLKDRKDVAKLPPCLFKHALVISGDDTHG